MSMVDGKLNSLIRCSPTNVPVIFPHSQKSQALLQSKTTTHYSADFCDRVASVGVDEHAWSSLPVLKLVLARGAE